MILQCPACSTRYVVPDAAIGVEGRRVRCANCKESWFAEGSPVAEPEMATIGNPGAADAERPAQQAPASDTPEQGEFGDFAREDTPPPPTPVEHPDPEPEAATETAYAAPSFEGIDTDPFAHAPPFKPRRNPARTWTMIAIAVAALLIAAIGALAIWGPFGSSGANPEDSFDLQLVRPPERRILSSGHELLSISVRITNLTDEEQPVPDIRAELRNSQGSVVYEWTIQAPQRTAQPREMLEINSAEIDIPRTAEELNLEFAEGNRAALPPSSEASPDEGDGTPAAPTTENAPEPAESEAE